MSISNENNLKLNALQWHGVAGWQSMLALNSFAGAREKWQPRQ